MTFRGLVTSIRLPHVRALGALLGDVRSFLRLHFLATACEAGLLRALPATREELVAALAVQRPELLDGLLELGLTVRELSLSGGRYRIRGHRARALVSEGGDPLAAMLEELGGYHSSVYQQLVARMRGAPLGTYLDANATIIARSSRMLEPLQRNFVWDIVRPDGALRLLEIGCGSGVYLRCAAERNSQLTGVAIELQEEVAELARANLREWGVGGRFEIVSGDARHVLAQLDGQFDIVTLYNNVYYFEEAERPALFREMRSKLAPGGVVGLVSLMRGRSMAGVDLDIALRSTAGCTALPDIDELEAQLREAGFAQVRRVKLMPFDPFYGLAATL